MPDRLDLTGLFFMAKNTYGNNNDGLVKALRDSADYIEKHQTLFVYSMSIEPYEPKDVWGVMLYVSEDK